MTDPGLYSIAQDEEKDIDVVVITHEHSDHLHIESLKKVILNNPKVKIFCNSSVGKLLKAEGLKYSLAEDGHWASMNRGTVDTQIQLHFYGDKHATIYKELSVAQNTGVLIDEKFFYPGDCFYKIDRPVDILALPVAGPWLKISESIDYALDVKPRVCFPVHDGMLKIKGIAHKMPDNVLNANRIKFVVIEDGKEADL